VLISVVSQKCVGVKSVLGDILQVVSTDDSVSECTKASVDTVNSCRSKRTFNNRLNAGLVQRELFLVHCAALTAMVVQNFVDDVTSFFHTLRTVGSESNLNTWFAQLEQLPGGQVATVHFHLKHQRH
jgi:hypothetical protein